MRVAGDGAWLRACATDGPMTPAIQREIRVSYLQMTRARAEGDLEYAIACADRIVILGMGHVRDTSRGTKRRLAAELLRENTGRLCSAVSQTKLIEEIVGREFVAHVKENCK